MSCSICNEEITADPNGWDGGHNAEPINNGRCCGSCNASIVTPARFGNYIIENSMKDIEYMKRDMLKMMDKIDDLDQSIINIKYLLKNKQADELQNIVDQQSFEDHKGVK